MTEQEWLECTDYLAMLIYLRGTTGSKYGKSGRMNYQINGSAGRLVGGIGERASQRKMRLTTAAICQKWCALALDGEIGQICKLCETITQNELLWNEAIELGTGPYYLPDIPLTVAECRRFAWDIPEFKAKESVSVLRNHATKDELEAWAWGGGPPDPLWQDTRNSVQHDFSLLLREIIGNPFRSITLNPASLTPSLVVMAQSIYADRAFDRLPVLADALEKAGCTDAEILAHCPGPGPHIRGCWVVDLLLGKE